MRERLLCLILLLGSGMAYSDVLAPDTLNQVSNNADRIAAQAQINMTQQQQILSQRLQALSAAMQAQVKDVPAAAPVQMPAPLPQTTTRPQQTPTQPALTQQPNVSGLPPPSQNNNNQNNNNQNNNQWNYGF